MKSKANPPLSIYPVGEVSIHSFKWKTPYFNTS